MGMSRCRNSCATASPIQRAFANDRHFPPRHPVVMPPCCAAGSETGFFLERTPLPEYRHGAVHPRGFRLDQRHLVAVGVPLLKQRLRCVCPAPRWKSRISNGPTGPQQAQNGS